MYGFGRYRTWAPVWAVFVIAIFIYLFVTYGEGFFTPLFIGALVTAVAVAIYVIIRVTLFVVKTMKEDMDDR